MTSAREKGNTGEGEEDGGNQLKEKVRAKGEEEDEKEKDIE